MTTARTLITTALDEAGRRDVGQGELSLALAGAELVDLLALSAVRLDVDRILPDAVVPFDDPLLAQAAAAVVRQEPYETAEDWLWRRGQELAAAYADALKEEGRAARRRDPRNPPVADERALSSLARSAGLRGTSGAEAGDEVEETATPVAPEDAVGVVLVAVENAVTELEAVRQRRAIEQAAFDNIWRAP
ncbi:GPP34 family phosphoprotein [Yinghuangia sp. YIM S09857]|uniref:GPP34 family phosphoprotein n=1 Tax=Yinghuangia sp. YIM S09857 TaxID=3436929 RepID=UPI003F537CDD